MANTQSWADLDNIYTHTGPAILKKELKDTVFDVHPALAMLKAGKHIKKANKTGKKLIFPIGTGTNPTITRGSSRDAQTLQVGDYARTLEFPWGNVYGNVTFEDEDLHDNAGPAEILNLIQTAMKATVASVDDVFSVDINGGTGNQVAGQEFYQLGWKDAVADATWAHPTNYGGIAAATYTGWNAQFVASNGLSSLVSDMGTLFRACTIGDAPNTPDLILTDATGHGLYEDFMAGDIRYNDLKVGDASFKGLDYKGVPVVFDRDVTLLSGVPSSGWTTGSGADTGSTHRFYFLNMSTFWWVFDPEWNFDKLFSDPWRIPTNQFARTKLLDVRSQFVTDERRKNGVLRNVPTS